MDIVIYTNPEILLHKREPDCFCFWSMKYPPKHFKEGDKIYFAVKGEIQGSFLCDEFYPDSEETIIFSSNSWKQLDGVHNWQFCKPFRGFRYKWWKEKDE